MLRDYAFRHHPELIKTLEQFNIELPKDERHISVLRFEVVSPDSFMWRIAINEAVYYLYAEDYVSGLEHVKTVFNTYIERTDWKLIDCEEKIPFKDTSLVRSATTYLEPPNPQDFMRFAVSSGYDFVFLACSSENIKDAFFSDNAPRGYKS